MSGVCLLGSNWNAKCSICKGKSAFGSIRLHCFIIAFVLSQIECMVAAEIMQRYRKLQFEKGKWKEAVCPSEGSWCWGTCACVLTVSSMLPVLDDSVTHSRQIGQCRCEDERDVSVLALDTCRSSWPHAVTEWRLLPVLSVFFFIESLPPADT